MKTHELEPTLPESALSVERWNHFSTVVVETLELIRPKDNTDIVAAAMRHGMSEADVIKVYRRLSELFNAVHADNIPSQE